MRVTDKVLNYSEALPYLPGRNLVPHSRSPVWTTGASGAAPFADSAQAGISMTINEGELLILHQPESQFGLSDGDRVVFTTAACGATGYQWQYSYNGTDWSDLRNSEIWNGRLTATLSFTLTAANEALSYRCKITNGDITVYTNTVRASTAEE